MNVLVTGGNGFVGKNICLRLNHDSGVSTKTFVRADSLEVLKKCLLETDFVIHLAGENRPKLVEQFERVNVELTKTICNILTEYQRSLPIVFASSIHATTDTPYGISKRRAELALIRYAKKTSSPVAILRLPSVFGKWCRPNYNSFVTTILYNIANNLEVPITDSSKRLSVAYIDDVVDTIFELLKHKWVGVVWPEVKPEYYPSLGEISDRADGFKKSRQTLQLNGVGSGFVKALYSTYITYLPKREFCYKIPQYSDARGVFAEFQKTLHEGQVSFFTLLPNSVRGGHFHHSKTEKFLVIQGTAMFRFMEVSSGERYELNISGENLEVVETIPGWAHEIINVGAEKVVCLLWANETFDPKRPDTFSVDF